MLHAVGWQHKTLLLLLLLLLLWLAQMLLLLQPCIQALADLAAPPGASAVGQRHLMRSGGLESNDSGVGAISYPRAD